MSVRDFWHLKYGTVVSHDCDIPGWGWQGKVVKRQVLDEWCGLIISKRRTADILTGRKLLEVTFDVGGGDFRYVQSNRPDAVKELRIVSEGGAVWARD
jgi:hypothetical protein